MISDKVNKFAELLSKSTKQMSYTQRNFAKKLLEDILTTQLMLEAENTRLKSKLSGVDSEHYDTELLKCISVLKLLGVTLSEMIHVYKKHHLDFICKNAKSVGKLTVGRLNNICEIIYYHEVTRGQMPESLKDLKECVEEVKKLREQDIDIDKRLEEINAMSGQEIQEECLKIMNEYK